MTSPSISSILLTTLLFLSPSSAQSSRDREIDRIASIALQTPQASHQIPFTPILRSNPQYKPPSTWSWRVNITTFPAPDPNTPIELPSPKPSGTGGGTPNLLRISYDISWGPPGSPLPFPYNNSTVCVSAVMNIGTPPNITNLFGEEKSKSTDCTPVLGPGCVRAIEKGDICSPGVAISRAWSALPECQSTFGYMLTGEKTDQFTGEKLGVFGIQNSRLTAFTNARGVQIQSKKSGEGVFVLEERRAFDGGNETEVLQVAKDMLQVILFEGRLMCMRVDTRLKSLGGSEDKGSGDGNGNGGDVPNRAGEEDKDGSSALRNCGGGATRWALLVGLGLACFMISC
ncbi:hypothetical protein QBC38DRAFT_222375 [Podospora fimiseda]|uniref:Ecp2 effector protein domain-containing protein n=1 Tax=Podospora fimiseda TaxID=252190 RepID=A0AAN7H1D7_9PEZI|nr:hypothetical protein QBC38DRAFT_222375 [Podospora fimiseda]